MDGGGGRVGGDSSGAEFTAEGVERLRGVVEGKLMEFLGDYCDETLVDYVIVLLQSGKQKEGVAKELDVFLGDDNEDFVAWLWDHLSANSHLYAQPVAPSSSKTEESLLGRGEPTEMSKSSEKVLMCGTVQESEAGRQIIYQPKDMPGAGQKETKTACISELEDGQLLEDPDNKSHSVSQYMCSPKTLRKRRREREGRTIQHKIAAAAISAQCRMLRAAMLDVVKDTQQSCSYTTEPPTKRHHSSLSAKPATELEPQRTKPIVRRSKTVYAEVAKDLTWLGQPNGAFSRLNRGKCTVLDGNSFLGSKISPCAANTSRGDYVEKVHQSLSCSREVTIFNVETKVTASNTAIIKAPSLKRKIRDASNLLTKLNGKDREPKTRKSTVQTTTAPPLTQLFDGKGLHKNVSLEVSQNDLPYKAPSSSEANQAQGDPALRTIFVTNVHFGATKDALSLHFRKYGAVLNVTTSGLPSGSAYIEFSHKESADRALSLNGTSFMSRILKVSRKGSPEVSQPSSAPRAIRGSSPTSRLVRTAYPQPATVRGRFQLRLGVRSLQWKRGGGDASASTGSARTATPIPPAGRSFTYTRAVPKPSVLA